MKTLIILLILSGNIFGQNFNPPSSSSGSPIFFNGEVGFSFGDVQTINLSPGIGIKLGNLGIGGGLTYIESTDKRFTPEVKETIIGPKAFALYSLGSTLYLKTQYEHLEYQTSETGTAREETLPAWWAGGGYRIGKGGLGFSVEFLYDLMHDPDTSLTREPYKVQGGVNLGF